MKKQISLFGKIIRYPSKFRVITGLLPTEFWCLYQKMLPDWQKATQKQKMGRPYGLGEPEYHLFCLLVYYRTYVGQVFLGAILGVDHATVSRSIKRLEPILAKVLTLKKERKISKGEAERIFIDCTEQPVQRPSDKVKQKEDYSGKKKQHTKKTEIRMAESKEILHISEPASGSKHDFALYKEQPPLPSNVVAIGDSGYQGLAKLHSQVLTPRKKKQGAAQTEEDRQFNKKLARERIVIEHKIRELKVFQIWAQRYRNPQPAYGVKTAIIGGLVNLKNGF